MPYPGGKGAPGIYHRIIRQMPPHRVYIEAFLGGGAIMLKKRPATINIGLDMNFGALKVFSAVARSINLDCQLICADAVAFLAGYPWKGNELVYCDPPYLMETRSSKNLYYEYEMTEPEEHEELLKVLCSLPCKVLLSGYWSELYLDHLLTWRSISYTVVVRGGGKRTEFLWLNYPQPAELHDARFVGGTFRARQGMARKVKRWKRKFLNMPAIERAALMAALKEIEMEGKDYAS